MAEPRFSAPWRPIADAPKAGQLCLLLVDYSEEANRAAIDAEPNYVWSPNPLEDESVARTVGHNSFENTGEDRWEFAGWCWSQDHYTEGHGTPIAFIELDSVAPPPGGA